VEGKSGSNIYLNDGEGKITLYLKSGANIDGKNIKAGQKITATGLLAKVSGGLAIMPRGQADLILASSGDDIAGQIPDVATGSSAWTLPARENNSQPLIYMLIAAGGVIIILAGWLAKKYFFK
jgi:hypothetical protein